MKSFLTLGILAALCLGALAGTAKEKIIETPPHCVTVDEFYKPCTASKHGGYDCKVHISVKPLPECSEYDHQRFLQVPR
jgi:hypothetical protein